MLRFSTAGESHGESLVALISGLPAGVPVDQAFLDHELWRRQQGYGRGGRMRIEKDTAHILSGVRHGKTIGSPIAMTLANNDWKNWEEILPVESGDAAKHKPVTSPRPGHADLAGARWREVDLLDHQLSQILQVHVAGNELRVGVRDGDDRLLADVLPRDPCGA